MSAYTLPQTFTAPEHVAIETVRFDQEAAGHAYFDSFDGDVIMSEASRALGYGSAIPDVDPPLAFVSPQDLLLPPMIVVAPPKRTLSEVDDTPDLSEQKRRYAQPNFMLTVKNSPSQYQADGKGKQSFRPSRYASMQTVPKMATEGINSAMTTC